MDRWAALAWQQHQRAHCPGCGGLKAETFAKENQWAYVGEVHTCHQCAAIRRAEKKVSDLDGGYGFARRLLNQAVGVSSAR
ncbi:MAG: hypothetical protein JWN67_5042 [Actinomycetia bacterium]|nr:hypothetical protein [Actinomycetes bacterium]